MGRVGLSLGLSLGLSSGLLGQEHPLEGIGGRRGRRGCLVCFSFRLLLSLGGLLCASGVIATANANANANATDTDTDTDTDTGPLVRSPSALPGVRFEEGAGNGADAEGAFGETAPRVVPRAMGRGGFMIIRMVSAFALALARGSRSRWLTSTSAFSTFSTSAGPEQGEGVFSGLWRGLFSRHRRLEWCMMSLKQQQQQQ